MPPQSTTKRCTKCGEEKPLDQFHKDKSRRDGYRDRCKACVREQQADWRPAYVADLESRRAIDAAPETKRCTGCRADKPLSDFHKRAGSIDGLRPICKACVKTYQKEWQADPDVAAHRHAYEKQRQQTQERRQQQNTSARKRYAREDNVAARQAQTEQNRQRRQEARQAQLADPAYQEQRRRKRQAIKSSAKSLARRRARRAERYADPAYRDQVLTSQRARAPRYGHLVTRHRAKHTERYNTDPAYRKAYNARVNIANHKRRTLIQGAGSHTEAEWMELCARYDHRCLACGQQLPLTKDHVVPLSLGGDNTINNLQPLCLACNLRKHAKHVDYRP